MSLVFENYGINKNYVQNHEKWFFGDMSFARNQFCPAKYLTAIIKDKEDKVVIYSSNLSTYRTTSDQVLKYNIVLFLKMPRIFFSDA